MKGQAGRIYHLIFKPIFDLCPKEISLEDWAAFMLGVEERRIEQYEIIESFDVPGIYKPTSGKYFRGYTANRLAKPGTRIFVRFDKKSPDKIELEIPNDVGGREKVFQLTGLEWRSVERFCRWLELRADVEKRIREEKKAAREIESKRILDNDK